MRLWTVHPRFLDTKGLTAAWREGLLARKVLRGQTKGYTNHPQLIRFRNHPDPLSAIDAYLTAILAESRNRGYNFDASKIDENAQAAPIRETTGQLYYEWRHLLKKLLNRDPQRFSDFQHSLPAPHPLFCLVEGGVRSWEKKNTQITYAFTISFRLPAKRRLNCNDRKIKLFLAHYNTSVSLVALDSNEIGKSQWLGLSASGIKSEAEAWNLARTIKDSLLLSAANRQLDFDFGSDTVTGGFSSFYKEKLNQDFGVVAISLAHGITVYPESPDNVFPRISSDITVGIEFGDFLTFLDQKREKNIPDRLRTALELFTQINFESTGKSKFLNLISVIEILADLQERDALFIQHTDMLVSLINKSKLFDLAYKNQITSILGNMKYLPIGTCCADYISKHLSPDDGKKFKTYYSLRSKIMHGGVIPKPLPVIELQKIAHKLIIQEIGKLYN